MKTRNKIILITILYILCIITYSWMKIPYIEYFWSLIFIIGVFYYANDLRKKLIIMSKRNTDKKTVG